jgi:peptidoglycan/LPS O-acetylase OafA/YrhL
MGGTTMGLLRVTLALAVLLSHFPGSPFTFISGGTAVQGFFVVSGFYMALVLGGKYSDTRLFYTNRLLRLMPTYYVMMAVCAVCLLVLNASATATQEMFAKAYGHPGTASLMVVENLGVVGQDLLYWFRFPGDGAILFDPSGAPPAEDTPIAFQTLLVPQSWSLSLELMFYAIAPFLARMRWGWLAIICGASIALRFAGHLLPIDFGLWQGRLFPTVLFLFLLGMLAHRMLPVAEKLPRWSGYAALAALLALIAFLPQLKPDPEIGRWAIYFGIAIASPVIFAAFRTIAWDRWIGDLSYPIYLSHLAVIGLVLTFQPPEPFWVTLGGTLAISVLLMLLVDMPVDRWRQARVKRGVQPALSPAMAD